MSIYKPYTYLIGWSTHDKWYYGVRFSKNCNPDELWVTYFTSSNYVKELVKEIGEPDIIQIRKTFQDSKSARIWEHKVLKRMNVVKNPKWINKTDNISISVDAKRLPWSIKRKKNFEKFIEEFWTEERRMSYKDKGGKNKQKILHDNVEYESIKQFAKMMGISKVTAHNWLRKGKATRLG